MSNVTNHPSSSPKHAGVSRRAVATAGAWSVPAIASVVSGPLAAASDPTPCAAKVIDWGQIPVGTAVTPQDVLTAPGSLVTMSLAATGATTVSDNLTVLAGPDGGLSGPFLNVALPGYGPNSQSVTFTFSAPVRGVSFTIADIDSNVQEIFREGVSLSPESFVVTALGPELSGSGTVADPWVSTLGTSVSPTSSDGNVTVVFPGVIQSFTITLFDLEPNNTPNDHSIDVFNVTFDDCPVA